MFMFINIKCVGNAGERRHRPAVGISSEEVGRLRSAVWGRQGVHGQGLYLRPASPRGPNAVIGLEERCDADS